MIIDELIALLGYDVRGEEDLKRFNKGLDSVEKKAEKVGKALGKVAAVAGAAVAGAFTALGFSVLQTSAKFEKYQATLETIEGSTEKATAALDWIKDFAQTTPYEVDELTRSFVKLRSYGLDPMDGTMTVLGDTAAGMGKSIDQVVEALADASTFQFERLRELGIVASQAGDQVTFSWTENGKSMTKTIKKTSAEVSKFLKEVWGKKFGGAMIRQSKTWNGMLSNLGDSWTNFQLRIGEAGFFDAVKNRLADVMDAVERWGNDGTIEKVAKTLSNAFTWLADVLGAVFGQIANHVAFLSKHFEQFEPWIKLVATALGLMVAAAFPVTSAFILAGIAVDDLLTYLEGGESIIGNFIQWLQDLLGVSEDVAEAIAGTGAAISAGLLAAFALAPKSMAKLAGRFIIGPLIAFLGPALVTAITGLSTALVTGFTAAFALLSNPVGWAVILAGVAAALVAYFWDDLVSLWNQMDFASLGKKIGQGILDGLRSMGAAISGWFASIIPDWMKGGIVGKGGAVGGGSPVGSGSPVVGSGGASGAGKPVIDMPDWMKNFSGNSSKLNSGKVGANVTQDNSTKTQNTNVNAPVTVNVQQSTQAPAAVGKAVSDAIQTGARPARMQGGNTF